MLCASSAITMLDEHELVESLNGVFDRGERVDRVLQLLFMGIYFVPFKEGYYRILDTYIYTYDNFRISRYTAL